MSRDFCFFQVVKKSAQNKSVLDLDCSQYKGRSLIGVSKRAEGSRNFAKINVLRSMAKISGGNHAQVEIETKKDSLKENSNIFVY